jgi:prepilin-type N-terminal cleavage/methylation domain-containing protein
MKKQRENRGFTLMEILVSIGVMSLIAVVLINVYTGYNTVFAVQQVRAEVNGSAREIADEFKKTVLQASNVVISHDFSGVTYSSTATTSVLKMPSIDGAGDVVPASYDYVAFYASSTTAYKVTDGASGSARASSTRRLSSTLDTLAFTYNNANVSLATSTDVEIQTQKTIKGQTFTAHLRETARLRNI